MDGGYIKLYRQLLTRWQWSRPKWRGAWVWLLLNASWKDDPAAGLKRGQLWLSLRDAAKEWGMSKTEAQRFLSIASEKDDIVWQKSQGGRRRINCPHGTVYGTVYGTVVETVVGTVSSLVTICNYEKYQGNGQHDGTVFGSDYGTPNNCPNGTLLREEEEKNKKEEELSSPPSASLDRPLTKASPKPKKDTDPRIKRLIDYYSTRHTEIHGFKPQIFGAKDATLMRHILTTCETAAEAMARIDRFMADDFSWMDRPSWEIASLHKRINKYAVAEKSGGNSIWG